ncbi:folate-binding protein YgfZ [Planctomycetota bacterium]|nr:folate-binding protein YgfZ [Planctomycetota bacterium]
MTSSDSLLQTLLANGPFLRDAAPYRLLLVTGIAAGDFLQRLCSQDVLGMAPGKVTPAAFLDAKGKVQVTCLVQQIESTFYLETQEHQHERLLQMLLRYHFNEALTINAQSGVCRELVTLASEPVTKATGAIRFEWLRGAVRFVRWHAATVAELPAQLGAPLSDELAEALRLIAGIVKVGQETEPNTLALEAGLSDHCSTSKGCYTGQEIVARILTYGHTNRALCRLQLAAGSAIALPMPLYELVDQLAVGRVMSAVPVPQHELRVGLGYLPKDFQAADTKLALADGTAVTVLGVVD